MFHPKIILKIIGLLLYFEAIFLLGSIGVAFYYSETTLSAHLYTLALLVGFGLFFSFLGRNSGRNLSRKDGYIVVTLCWIVFSAFGSLPYLLSGEIPSVTDAFFETMSGFTTTGASIVDDVGSLPHSLLFWRAMTQWIGGLGIVFFTVAILPIFGLGDLHLFAAEATGPVRAKLHPKISVTARWILVIYISFTIICAIALRLAGMGNFDSVCHAMSTLSTGGFSTRTGGIEAFHSPLIEYVLILFMFLGGTNFSLLYLAFFKRRFGDLYRDGEFRTYVRLFIFFTIAIAIGLFCTSPLNGEEAFRTSMFQVISVQTTTGYNSVDYMLWTPVLWLLLLGVMFLGACSGSTTGAMKSVRVAILGRVMYNEFKRIVHPNAVIPVRLNRKSISTQVQSAILAFTVLYMGMVLLGIIVNVAFGLNFLDAAGLSVTCVGNVGPAVGNFGPANSFSSLPDVLKWFAAFQMMVGRLEFFAVLLLFTPDFWRRR